MTPITSVFLCIHLTVSRNSVFQCFLFIYVYDSSQELQATRTAAPEGVW